MKNNIKNIISCATRAVVLAGLSACSSQVLLTIDSEPSGAAVFEGGKFWGRTPVVLSYAASGQLAEGGCIGTRPLKVEWDSGAQARVATISVCDAEAQEQRFLFTYPAGFAEAMNDNVADSAAANQRRVAPNGELYWELAPEDGDATVRCYSDLSGATITTNCS